MAAATSASDHGGRWPLMYLFDRGTFGQTARNGRPQRPRQPKLRGKVNGRLIETTWNAGRSRYRPFAPEANGQRTGPKDHGYAGVRSKTKSRHFSELTTRSRE